jgi:hypothetical protein
MDQQNPNDPNDPTGLGSGLGTGSGSSGLSSGSGGGLGSGSGTSGSIGTGGTSTGAGYASGGTGTGMSSGGGMTTGSGDSGHGIGSTTGPTSNSEIGASGARTESDAQYCTHCGHELNESKGLEQFLGRLGISGDMFTNLKGQFSNVDIDEYLNTAREYLKGGTTKVTSYTKENPAKVAAGVAALALGAGLIYAAVNREKGEVEVVTEGNDGPNAYRGTGGSDLNPGSGVDRTGVDRGHDTNKNRT